MLENLKHEKLKVHLMKDYINSRTYYFIHLLIFPHRLFSPLSLSNNKIN